MKIKLVYCVLFLSFVGCSTPKTKKMTPLSDKEIKELGYQIKKEDTVFMKDGKLDILKLEKIASTSGSSEPPYYQYEDNIDNDIYTCCAFKKKIAHVI